MNPEPKFTVGQAVNRIENRDIPHGGTILQVYDYSPIRGYSYEISYEEGGQGSWPEDSLEAA
jgi:hypothetical protein